MKDMPFEKEMEKLEKIVSELEKGELTLDNSLKKYEEGIKLARSCQDKLEKARGKIELLMKKDGGKFTSKEFDEDFAEEE